MKRTYTLGTSEFGNPLPQIIVSYQDTDYRKYREKNSDVYLLAAEVERASIGEKWLVVPKPQGQMVHLELAECSKSEVERAAIILARIAAR